MKLFQAYLSFTLLAVYAQALDLEGWQEQSIYQVMVDRFARTRDSSAACGLRTWCGGTWKGLARHLDYIQGMGFTAVLISPIVKNIEFNTTFGNPYHGYWAQDIWEVNSHFGTEEDLIDLSSAIHARGMYLMVDVVVNHMSPVPGKNATLQYADYRPFNSSNYYHPVCEIDDSNQTSIDVCWQGSVQDGSALADLRTEDTVVRQIWKKWITEIVDKYEIDGLRIDSLKHVEEDFYPDFLEAAGVFAMGELLDGDPKSYPPWVDFVDGLFNYPLFFWVTRAFQSRLSTMTELVTGVKTSQGLMKTSSLGTFLESHDQKRFGNLNGDMALAKNAIAFTMLMDGIPAVYQGQEQHFSGGSDPDNRQGLWTSGYSTDAELYTWFALLNRIRSLAIAQDQAYIPFQASPIWSDDHTVAMKKAQVVSVLTNMGVGPARHNVSLPASGTGYSAGQEIVDLAAPGCKRYRTSSSGSLAFEMTSAPKVFYPAAKLEPGDLCCGTENSSQDSGLLTSLTAGLSANFGSSGGLSAVSSTSTSASNWPIQVDSTPVCYVTFNQTRTTSFGDAIKLLGNIPQLGSWDANQALTLDASYYTDSSHTHVLTLALKPGTEIEYTFLEVDGAGVVTWEGESIKEVLHTYTVPKACKGRTQSVYHVWETTSVLRRRDPVRRRETYRVASPPYSYRN